MHFFYSKFMDNIYIEYHFTVTPKEPGTEILIAELGALVLRVLLKMKMV